MEVGDRVGGTAGDPPGRGQRRAGLSPWLASELGFGHAHATRNGADAADGDASIGDVAVVERDRHGDADRGPLEEAELEVRRRRPRRQRRDHDLGQELVALQARLERPDEESFERDRARAPLLLDARGGVEDLQQRPGVGVGLGEAEVAAERAHLAHAHVRHVGFHPRDGREVLANERIALEGAMRRGRAEPERAGIETDAGQARDGLHVHEVLVVDEPFLHGEDQLGTARVDARGVSVTREQLGGLGHGGRLAQLEGPQHAVRPSPRAGLSRPERSDPRCRSPFSR